MFKKGDLVKFEANGEQVWGIVVAEQDENGKVFVAETGRAFQLPAAKITLR